MVRSKFKLEKGRVIAQTWKDQGLEVIEGEDTKDQDQGHTDEEDTLHHPDHLHNPHLDLIATEEDDLIAKIVIEGKIEEVDHIPEDIVEDRHPDLLEVVPNLGGNYRKCKLVSPSLQDRR